jgi:flagellar basal body P-ring formation protein FlgA
MVKSLFIAVALLGTSVCAWAEDTVTLKQEAYVKGDKVLLGEIANIEGPNAKQLATIEVTNSAIPGSARRIDAALLRSRIDNAGYSDTDVELKGTPRVTATTMSLELTGDILAEELRGYIHETMPWPIEDTEIDIQSNVSKAVIPDGDYEINWRVTPSYKYLGLGTFRGEIMVNGEPAKTIYAKATIKTYAEVLVTNSGVSRGERLTVQNVSLEKRELSDIKSGVFFDLDELDGAIAKSSIYEGEIISPRKVMAPIIVKRNQMVNVESQNGSLIIRTRAQSLGDASAGDVIACRNVSSKEEFVGIVRKDGVVVIQ